MRSPPGSPESSRCLPSKLYFPAEHEPTATAPLSPAVSAPEGGTSPTVHRKQVLDKHLLKE